MTLVLVTQLILHPGTEILDIIVRCAGAAKEEEVGIMAQTHKPRRTS